MDSVIVICQPVSIPKDEIMPKKKHKKKKRAEQHGKRFDVDPDRIINMLTIDEGKSQIFTDPKTCGPIERVVIPKGGGVDTYIEGQKYPYPGYPDRETTNLIDAMKKTTKAMMNFLSSLGKFKLLLIARNIKKFVPLWIGTIEGVLHNHRLKPRFYPRPVREIYRVFNVMIGREDDQSMKDKWAKIRDIVCMALLDDVYLFRLQDMFSEINVDEMKLDKRELYYALKKANYNFGGKKQ